VVKVSKRWGGGRLQKLACEGNTYQEDGDIPSGADATP
jgi:hypothetical protein